MSKEYPEGIELLIELHKKLTKKEPNNNLLNIVEVDKTNIKKSEGFDKKYSRDSDESSLPALVRYSLDLLKAIKNKGKEELVVQRDFLFDPPKPYNPANDQKYDGWDEWD